VSLWAKVYHHADWRQQSYRGVKKLNKRVKSSSNKSQLTAPTFNPCAEQRR